VRVAVYKKQNGFDWRRPRIAVIVQRQIASDVAGVGFSVNPLTNSYDEAVFNANFGLGETVVAGTATPDLFVVDRLSRSIVETTIGKKEISIWLRPDGGTEERANPSGASVASLTSEQVLALTDHLIKIEDLYGRPMDIEWAFAGGEMFLLQARPITTHYALPTAMITAPGGKKRLYWDVTISVQGLFNAITPMGARCFKALLASASGQIFGKNITADIDTTVPFVEGGRIWVNLSNTLTIAPLAKHVGFLPVIDPVCAAALATVDEDAYRAEKSVKQVPWNLVWHAPAKVAQVFEARLLPEHARKSVDRGCETYLRDLRAAQAASSAVAPAQDQPFSVFAIETMTHVARFVFGEVMPYFAMSKLAMSLLRGMFGDDATAEQRSDLAKLDQSLPGNVTVEMGLALAELPRLLPKDTSADALARAIAARTAPAAFLSAWDVFIERYGHRGPGEIDVASPRFREDPRMLLAQIAQATSSHADSALLPDAIFERSQAERHDAFERLAEAAHAKGVIASRRFHGLCKVVESLGGLRETPKFTLVLAIDAVRTRALAIGSALVAAGRLHAQNDVFDVTLEDVDRALADPSLDVAAIAAKGRADRARYDRLGEKPRLIDSRGRIIRPPRAPASPGELAGFAVSNGTARGRVKVLHTPDEKPLAPGEILVARATDPGWTPLFVNAAAVVLEVGGMMQHGALVAREYGKPCVVGIEDATSRLHDGDLVEVDGTGGVVRIVEKGTGLASASNPTNKGGRA
jgi:pyruvate,water dikinase